MFSVLPSELLLSDEYSPPSHFLTLFLCSETPLRQGCKGADLLWFFWTRRRQTDKDKQRTKQQQQQQSNSKQQQQQRRHPSPARSS